MPSTRLRRMLTLATLLTGPGILLPGCASSNGFATLKPAGEAFPRAEYQVLGKTRFDQTWIDKTIEAEVVGFGFDRPQKRPASFDAAPASHTVVVIPPVKPVIPIITPAMPAVVTVVPKKSFLQRAKDLKAKELQRLKNWRYLKKTEPKG